MRALIVQVIELLAQNVAVFRRALLPALVEGHHVGGVLLPFVALAAAISRLSDLVHSYSSAIVTLGGARADNLWAWDADALGLDVLQLHAYPDSPHPGDVDVFGTPARGLDVRRDVILGEFRSSAPLDECLENALAGGYAGAWPWSFSGTDTYGRLPVDALKRFGTRHPELVNRRFSMSP